MITAKVIADSIQHGARIMSLELEMPRFILAQFNTHRAFSRSAASSRAIPVAKLLKKVKTDPFVPIHFGANQPGMQAGTEIKHRDAAVAVWRNAAEQAASHAELLRQMGVHKQVTNRLLEPFLTTRVIVTATDWTNFFNLRLDDAAQPEIQRLALAMKRAIMESTPRRTDWHVPYVTESDLCLKQALMVSAARCARVSYDNHNGERDIDKDMALAERLLSDRHMSPFEHAARYNMGRHANLNDWQSYRNMMEA